MSANNFSDIADQNKSKLSQQEDICVGLYLVILSVLSVVFNAPVLLLVWKKRKKVLLLDMHIVSLAISGLCPAVSAYPFAAASSFQHRWAYGSAGCKRDAFIVFCCGNASIGTLVVLSVFRCWVICFEPQGSKHYRYKVVLSLIGIYVWSGLWAIAPLLGWGEYAIEPFGTACSFGWEKPDRSYVVLALIFCYAVPLCIMCLCYAKIVMTVRTQQAHASKKYKRMDIYLAKLAGVMSASFILAWTPYAVLTMWMAFGNPALIPIGVTLVPSLIAKCSTVHNPIIYFFAIKNYRSDLKNMLKFTRFFQTKYEYSDNDRRINLQLASADRSETGTSPLCVPRASASTCAVDFVSTSLCGKA